MKAPNLSVGVESIVDYIFTENNPASERYSRQIRACPELQLFALLIVVAKSQPNRLAHEELCAKRKCAEVREKIALLISQTMEIQIEENG